MATYHKYDLELPDLDYHVLLMQELVDGYAGSSISGTPQFVRYVCDDQTPEEIKQWYSAADEMILTRIKEHVPEPLQISSRQFLIYMPGNEGHRLHVDQIYMGPLGEIEPFVTLLYVNDFSGGELVYGGQVLNLAKNRLLLLPTREKIPHKVQKSNGIRVVYRPSITLVESDNQVIQFSRFLLSKLGNDFNDIKPRLKGFILEYLDRQEVAEEFLED